MIGLAFFISVVGNSYALFFYRVDDVFDLNFQKRTLSNFTLGDFNSVYCKSPTVFTFASVTLAFPAAIGNGNLHESAHQHDRNYPLDFCRHTCECGRSLQPCDLNLSLLHWNLDQIHIVLSFSDILSYPEPQAHRLKGTGSKSKPPGVRLSTGLGSLPNG
jgi:hypothetical protein